jgi:dolichol-phosphate mannosyltransferase
MQSLIQQSTSLLHRDLAMAKTEPAILGVSVVIPLYNEYEGVAGLLRRLLDFQASVEERYECEFVLVDDGSSDGTAQMLEELLQDRENFHVVRHPLNRGIAAAIHTGLLNARHECVVSIDSDGSYDLTLLDQMLGCFKPGVDLITASPYHPAGKVENLPAWRIMLSRCASQMYRVATGNKLTCFTSCFRVYRRERFIALPPSEDGFVGVAELLWLAQVQGLSIIEHPAVLKSRAVGKSKMRLIQVTVRHLRLLVTIGLNRMSLSRSVRHPDEHASSRPA